MIRIDRVVTRGGDGGKTSLGDGTRVSKDALRVDAFGTVDEANATIGVLRATLTDDPAVDAALARIQNDLFDVGADLCVPGQAGDRLRLTDAPSAALEAEIATLNAGLAPLTSFILPGGSLPAAHAHVARTVTRRAERLVVALAAERQDGQAAERQENQVAERPDDKATEAVNPAVIRYLNRLSDYLFVLARHLNRHTGDVQWVPGANR